MNAAARSVFVFGVYLLGMGLGLLAVPALTLAPFGLPAPQEPWVRVLGLVAACLGCYYVVAARQGLEALIRATVPVRLAAAAGFALLVAAGQGPVVLLLFGAVDAAAAGWTWWALRAAALPARGVAHDAG